MNYIGLSYVVTLVQHSVFDTRELGKIDKDVYRIAESKIGIEPELLDKPVTLDI